MPLRIALELAEKGWGQTAPNPMVGAVVFNGDEKVGEGFHQRFGEPHAEVGALKAAGERARGATLYVNLEPCNHQGRNPPCTEAIIASGVTRVVAAVRDPNPIAAGGAERLKAAGIDVEFGKELTGIVFNRERLGAGIANVGDQRRGGGREIIPSQSRHCTLP